MNQTLIANDTVAGDAAHHLAKDNTLAPLIDQFGFVPFRPHTDYYRELVESIIGQQLSVKAAASINRRFVGLFGGNFPLPVEILGVSPEHLRKAGLSGAKARYVQDLASHVLAGTLELEKMNSLKNDDIIRELTTVKGIGEWTAHMFLIFSLGRMDVLAHGDLGVRTGIMRLYGLSNLPNKEQVLAIAKRNNWHPYESAACWYIWQSLDNSVKA